MLIVNLIILLIGVWLRWYRVLETNGFGWDQMQLVKNGLFILQSQPLLIGPRVGPTGFFLPPVYYYISALFLWFFHLQAKAVYYVPSLIGLAGGISAYYIGYRMGNKRAGTAAMAIYLLSPLMVVFDRIPWNVNFIFLTFCWAFYFLWKICVRKSRQGLDYWWLGLTVGLTISAHFTGVLLIPLLLICIIYYRLISRRIWLTVLGVLINLAPLLIFDVRHDWLNAGQLTKFLFSGQSQFSFISYLQNMIIFSLNSWQNWGEMLIGRNHALWGRIIGGGIMLAMAWQTYRRHKLAKLSLIYILSTLLIFAFYRGETPEYYFFYQLPVVSLFVSTNITSHSTRIFRAGGWIYICYACYLSWNIVNAINRESFRCIQNTIKAGQDYVAGIPGQSFKISYIMRNKDQLTGFSYLVEKAGFPIDSLSGNELFFVAPVSVAADLTYQYTCQEVGLHVKHP